MEKFVMAAGTAVRYADAGKGTQTVLLLHGYLESIEVWDDFAGQLGTSYRMLRLDLPGHGFSDWGGREVIDIDYMADVAAAVLEIAGVEKCTVVGHSMGGYVALALAANRQREIELVEAGKKEMHSRVNPGKGFAQENLRRCSEAIEDLAEQVMMTEDEAIVAILKGMSRRKDRNEEMRNLTIPELMIFGRGDNYIPVAAAETMIAAQPQARVAWLDGSGHMGFVEQPAESLAILKDFLAEVAARKN